MGGNRKVVASIVCGEQDVDLVEDSLREWFKHNGMMLMTMLTSVTRTTTEEDWRHQQEVYGQPWGVTIIFLAVVVGYPWIILWMLLFGSH